MSPSSYVPVVSSSSLVPMSSPFLLSHALHMPSPGLAANAMRGLFPTTSAMTPSESSSPVFHEPSLLPVTMGPPLSSVALNTHPLQTRTKSGIFNPKYILSLSTSINEV